jgi:hypothetical protein
MPPKYEPDAPRLKEVHVDADNQRVTITWYPARDSDEDLIGYRVYASAQSRGWNYQTLSGDESVRPYFAGGWNPDMYERMFTEPPGDLLFIQTSETSVTFDLPPGKRAYITVMPYDEHGENVGRRLYDMSEELNVVVPWTVTATLRRISDYLQRIVSQSLSEPHIVAAGS